MPPTTPLTDHVTVVVAVFVTLPTNATLVRHLLVIEVGEIVTTTGSVEAAVPAVIRPGLLVPNDGETMAWLRRRSGNSLFILNFRCEVAAIGTKPATDSQLGRTRQDCCAPSLLQTVTLYREAKLSQGRLWSSPEQSHGLYITDVIERARTVVHDHAWMSQGRLRERALWRMIECWAGNSS